MSDSSTIIIRRWTTPLWPVAVFAASLGLLLWLLGASSSLDGWYGAIMVVTSRTGIPSSILEPTGVWRLLMIPIGIIYTYAEMCVPFVAPHRKTFSAWIITMTVLMMIHATDVASTLYALMYQPSGPRWAVHVWAVNSSWPVLVWSIVLTYLPERLLLISWRIIFARATKDN